MMKFTDSIHQSMKNNRNLWLFISAVVILILATLLRQWNLGAESAWIDEAYSIELVKHSLVEIITGTAADQHPPLYYLLLHFWLRIGSGVTYARLLSVILGVINIAQILHFGYKTGGVYIGLIGALLLAISPMHVWYSQEIRMYMLLLCLTTASTTALWWALRNKHFLYWFLYCLFSILALYTHYFAAFIILTQGIWVLTWMLKGYSKNDLWKWIASTVITGLLFLPWLPTAINQARFHTMTWVESPTIFIIRDTLLRLVFGIAVLSLPDLLLWAVLVVVLGITFWAFKEYLPIFSKNEGAFFYAVSWGIFPFIAISIVALIFPVYQFKQYLIVVAPILLLCAWISYRLPRGVRIAALFILVLAASFSLIYQQVALTKDNWKGAAEYIQQNTTAGDVLFGNPAASSLALALYADVTAPFLGTPSDYNIISGGWEGEMLTSEATDNTFGQLSETYHRVWLIEFFPEFWDEDKTVENWLESHSILVDEHWFSRIRVRIYNF
jgi:uncharacterized membrane protein